MDLLQDTGAKALETRHLRPVEHVNVDMDTVLHDLRLGHFVAPDAEPPLWGIEGDGIVWGCLGIGWAYRIAEDCGPEMGHAVVVGTVETDIAEARGGHKSFLLLFTRGGPHTLAPARREAEAHRDPDTRPGGPAGRPLQRPDQTSAPMHPG